MELRDYRLWWSLYVFFGVLSLLVVKRRHRRWKRAKALLAELPGGQRAEPARRVRIEGWRLGLMTAALLAMTGLLFAALLQAPATVLFALRLVAVLAVSGVVVLGLPR